LLDQKITMFLMSWPNSLWKRFKDLSGCPKLLNLIYHCNPPKPGFVLYSFDMRYLFSLW
jgi:hypothetical protein